MSIETPAIPDVLDAGDVAEGLGAIALRRVRRMCRVLGWFQVETPVRIPNLIEIPNFLISWVNYEFARHRRRTEIWR